MQPTVIPQPGSHPEFPFLAPGRGGLRAAFGSTREERVERQLAALLIGISLNNGYEAAIRALFPITSLPASSQSSSESASADLRMR